MFLAAVSAVPYTYMDKFVHVSHMHPAVDIFTSLSVQLLLIWISYISGNGQPGMILGFSSN